MDAKPPLKPSLRPVSSDDTQYLIPDSLIQPLALPGPQTTSASEDSIFPIEGIDDPTVPLSPSYLNPQSAMTPVRPAPAPMAGVTWYPAGGPPHLLFDNAAGMLVQATTVAHRPTAGPSKAGLPQTAKNQQHYRLRIIQPTPTAIMTDSIQNTVPVASNPPQATTNASEIMPPSANPSSVHQGSLPTPATTQSDAVLSLQLLLERGTRKA